MDVAPYLHGAELSTDVKRSGCREICKWRRRQLTYLPGTLIG
jgi:hypothetical protein